MKNTEFLLQMRKLFIITEKHILEFLDYVPPKKKHLDVESPYIFNMIMESGPQIEPMMMKMIELIKPCRIEGQDLFGECYKYLNKNGMISIQKVITKDEGTVLKPFYDSGPQWWKAYNNHIKHTLPKGIEKATLKNLLNIHASLFIMHNIFYMYDKYIIDTKNFVDQQNWLDCEEEFRNDTAFSHMLTENGYVSKVFYNVTIYKPTLGIPI